MTVVPDLRGQLVTANEILKLLLVLRALEKQPVRRRITNPVTENHVQSKRDFVDEVVHVTFQAAIIITAKHEALLVIDKYPAREMNRRHAREMSARVDVSCRVLDKPQQDHECPTP